MCWNAVRADGRTYDRRTYDAFANGCTYDRRTNTCAHCCTSNSCTGFAGDWFLQFRHRHQLR